MSIRQSANNATTQFHAWVPQMPGYTDWKDKAFEDMRTPEEQIWWLYAHNLQLPDTTDYDNLNDLIKKLQDTIAGLLDTIADLVRRMGGLESEFQALCQNGMDYDVTKGTFAPTMPAQRRMWQAQMFDGMTVEDLSQFTVTQAKGMNVRHVAVDGRVEYMGTGHAKPEIPWQDGWTSPEFRPDDYVKKSDFVLIDTDNLADHTVMGVLKKTVDTKCPKPAPYLRRGTVTDLKHLLVRSDDALYTVDPSERG